MAQVRVSWASLETSGSVARVSWVELGVAAPQVTGSGDAQGLLGEASGNGSVIGPFVVQPPTGGGIIISRPAVVEPPPKRLPPVRSVRGKARIVGLLGKVKGRGYVLPLIFATGGTVASRGQAQARGKVELPTLALQLAVKACQVQARGHGRVVLPSRGRARAVSRLQPWQAAGCVIEPARGSGEVSGVRVTARAQGRVMRPLAWELEDLWLVGVGVGETDEELVLR